MPSILKAKQIVKELILSSEELKKEFIIKLE